MRIYYTTKDGDYLNINSENGHGIKENCFPREHVIISDFNESELIKVKKKKYIQELNKIHKTLKIEWEYNGTKFRRLDCIETCHWGNIDNYYLHNFDRGKPNTEVTKPILPFF